MMKYKPFFYLIALIPIILLLIHITTDKKNNTSFISNPELLTIAPHEDWKGNPLDEKGRFINLYHPFESGFKDFFKWQLSKNPYKEEKKNEEIYLKVKFEKNLLSNGEDYLIWLGHSSYLIKINGVVFITDPIIFDNTFLKRKIEFPIAPENLPAIDFILLSHNHRDHLDANSLKFLREKNKDLKILTGLGISDIIKGWFEGNEIQEAGWYQQYSLVKSDLKITYVPSRHWSRRWLWDDNKSLWGGFFIQSTDFTIYFMGDSGYGPHFKDIMATFGPPDYCLMGIGAFRPEWFMHQAHISPEDAIKAFNEMSGKYFIPMHFGTFDLSDEPLMQPLDILLENENRLNGKLIIPTLGQNLF